MVELCELKILPDAEEWPEDMDNRIANLDFGAGDSLFGSILDQTLSTDSLDSEQLRARCQYNKNDYKITVADSGQWASGHFTTWGRIHSAEPLDEKTASAPDMTVSPRHSYSRSNRPASLLANFTQRQDTVDLLDNRYLDVNDNEVNWEQRADRWRAARPASLGRTPQKPRRTFADLTPRSIQRNPELQFLQLPHQMPTLCESSLSFSDIMLKMKKDGMPNVTTELDLLPPLLQDNSPDSGIGCSGPVHIEDWSSLSVLLPKHVADACSFFKQNSQLLGGTSTSAHSNCIEGSRRLPEPCRTCYRVRRRLHPPHWAQNTQSRHVLCDCTASEIIDRAIEFAPRPRGLSARAALHTRELSIIGLPIYATKRQLVEAVVEGVASVLRGDGSSLLCSALVALVEDGLEGTSTWGMISTLTAPGPATKDVYRIVKELDSTEKSESLKAHMFFDELLKDCSLDCWLCYVILKENVLAKMYAEGAFLLNAPSAYRSLLWRLVEGLELLSTIEARETRSMLWSGASRMASDSRVPKSSSVPARLNSVQKPRSRIPLPTRRVCYSHDVSRSPLRSQIASVIEDSDVPGQLSVKSGERVRVLQRRGGVARCCRVRQRRSHVFQGIVPLSNLLMN